MNDDLILKLSSLEYERDTKQHRCSEIFDAIQQRKRELDALQTELDGLQGMLEPLDEQIQVLSDRIGRLNNHDDGQENNSQSQYMTQIQTQVKLEEQQQQTQSLTSTEDEVLATQEVVRISANVQLGGEVSNHRHIMHMPSSSSIGNHQKKIRDHNHNVIARPALQLVNDGHSYSRVSSGAHVHQGNTSDGNGIKGTLDSFIISNNNRAIIAHTGNNSAAGASSMSTSTSNVLQPQQQDQQQGLQVQRNYYGMSNRPTSEERSAIYLSELASMNFPWSEKMSRMLLSVFNIQNFRENQKEVINCTMNGDDVFVIMRTGGGKSLTYQLPALLERDANPSKVTLVISPLLSLIEDQVDQMNAFVRDSATSFVSGLGAQEHAARWAKVRDPRSGCAIIFVTPEKIVKNNKLRGELEKLNEQKRLGRFVIDEAHCATQWGHDFRPDYVKLGLLKYHFPNVPLIAVTATASNTVRDDVCRILKLGKNYQFFRSTANRPNLNYSVRQKHDSKEKVVGDIAMFIKENHKNHAGIIYTFSKKDADTVADGLTERGIIAASYHSDVSTTRKSTIHRNWMRNQCQVVVATIAFGLGINKPDVRFVIHHSLSKSLEGYYQESGRAGRDGEPGECILYFSPKDVPRMICMIHGDNGEPAFWSMVRYGLSIGDDSLYRSMLLRCLGEEGNIVTGESSGFNRDVTKHAITVTKLAIFIQNTKNDVTLPQLVTQWRAKKDTAPCVKENSPGNDVIKEECERIIVHLLLSEILHPKVTWNAYASTMYIIPGPKAHDFITSPRANVQIQFPHRAASRKSVSSKKSTSEQEAGWVEARPGRSSKVTKRTILMKESKSTRNGNSSKQGSRFANAVTKRRKILKEKPSESIDVIELSDSESEQDLDVSKKPVKQSKDIFESSSSDEEFIANFE